MSSTEIITVDISAIQLKFKHDMEYFKEYIEFNKQKLEERRKILDTKFELDEKEDPNAVNVLIQIYNDDYTRIPAYFYHSSIISLFSLLEYSLNQICNEIILTTKVPLQLKDLAGSNIVHKAKI